MDKQIAYDLEITNPIQELNDLKEQVLKLSTLCTVLAGMVVLGFENKTPDMLYRLQQELASAGIGFEEEELKAFDETFEKLHFTYMDLNKDLYK